MVDQNGAYTFQKRGIFYFSKRVPSDLSELYKVGRLTYSLKTKCPKTAEKQVRDALQKLELYWNRVRMDNELPKLVKSAIDVSAPLRNVPKTLIPDPRRLLPCRKFDVCALIWPLGLESIAAGLRESGLEFFLKELHPRWIFRVDLR